MTSAGGAISEGPVSASTEVPPLVGQVGQEFVQNTLSGRHPREAIEIIQSQATFRNPRCAPLLGFLDQLGLARSESHKYVVKKATQALLERIPKMSSDKLLSLLEESFRFIGIMELRSIPLAVLDRLDPIPVNYVKRLAMDNEVFWDLPTRVQRQVWEMDRKLLQHHAMSLIASYKYETATWMQGLDMDIGMREGKDGSFHPQLGRKMLRRGSAALRHLTQMVGGSTAIYRGISDICTVRFTDPDSIYVGMKEAAVCACKTQLLMSLHESGEAKVCATESSFSLVWALDACIRERQVDNDKLSEIEHFLESASKVVESKKKGKEKQKPSQLKQLKESRKDDDAESAGVPRSHQSARSACRDLGDAGMCLRDPAAFHLIVHEIIRTLEDCVAIDELPRRDTKLCSLTRILTVAVEVRYMFRQNTFYYPGPDPDIIQILYPCIAGFILDGKLRKMGEQGFASDSKEIIEAHREVVFIMVRSEIARKVVQIFCLQRLADEDFWLAGSLLDMIASCLDKIATAAMPEFAPFAYTLARRISTMLNEERISVTSEIWEKAVNKILLYLVDSETEAHEEILRMILAASPRLEIQTLGKYLDTCLENSSRSRQLHADRAIEEAALPPRGYLGVSRPFQKREDDSDDEYTTKMEPSNSGDGVKGTYKRFLAKYPALKQPGIAPILMVYLKS